MSEDNGETIEKMALLLKVKASKLLKGKASKSNSI